MVRSKIKSSATGAKAHFYLLPLTRPSKAALPRFYKQQIDGSKGGCGTRHPPLTAGTMEISNPSQMGVARPPV
jgi:hypothetical protein